jgi:hypothetical protein
VTPFELVVGAFGRVGYEIVRYGEVRSGKGKR